MDLDDDLSASWRPFANDLWITRRLNTHQITEHLRNVRLQLSPHNQVAIDDIIMFVETLRDDCSGLDFTTTKQWSELLNIMQISRRVNHQSVKFKDIMRNMSIIQTHIEDIRMLNTSAKLSSNVDSSLKNIEETLKSIKISIPSDSPCENLKIQELESTRDELQNRHIFRCHLIAKELNNKLILKSTALEMVESWRFQQSKLYAAIRLLAGFLDSLIKIEINLNELGPLMKAGGHNQTHDSMDSHSLRFNINECRKDFLSIIDFRHRLIARLRRSVKKNILTQTSELFLFRLLNAKYNSFIDDMYNIELSYNLETLLSCRARLDEILRNLRQEFGRFYFISDIELLSIICKDLNFITDNENIENMNMIAKLFNNSISALIVKNDYVLGVSSPIGEIVIFKQTDHIKITSKLNLYSLEVIRLLNDISRKLRKTLQDLIVEQFNQSASEIINWKLPTQLICLVEHIAFTREVEQILSRNTNTRLEDLVDFHENRLKNAACLDDTPIQKYKLSALISTGIGFITALGNLLSLKVTNLSDWGWHIQTKYYFVDGKVYVEIGDCSFEYRFDYLAPQIDNSVNQGFVYRRLVNTELTQICQLVTSYAVSKMGLGSNPYGPAGSGKTETIKALGNLLGCQVVVHNCDDSNDSDTLGRLIWGLAHTGMWGCFDEFNRLNTSALSSISGILEQVQGALRQKKSTIQTTDGKFMCVEESSGFFITLNPSDGLKYRGRRVLPSNIRNLFLPVSMSQVDNESIVYELLMVNSMKLDYGHSFTNKDVIHMAKGLNRWLVAMKDMNLETCELDLRLILAILKRFELLCKIDKDRLTAIDHLFASAILIEIQPRLDILRRSSAKALLEEIFTCHLDLKDFLVFRNISKDILSQKQAPLSDLKSIELYQQLETRAGVILYGPTGSGKSRTWKLLLESLGDSVSYFVINPKACSKKQLFGHIDNQTKRWADGILTKLVRDAQKILLNEQKISQVWLILDGPMDPDWVENLNSVLDDNKTLTLGTGEHLDFHFLNGNDIKLIFEIDNLSNISPATLSRLGLVIHHEDQAIERPEILNGHQLCIIDGTYDLRTLALSIEISEATPIYYCHRLSKSGHLTDFMRRMKDGNVLCLMNIDIIDHEDEWKNKSFIELVRFMIDNGGYYNDTNFHTFRPQLIMTAEESKSIDKRLLNSTQLVQKYIKRLSDCSSPISLEDLIRILLERDQETSNPITTIVLDRFGSGSFYKIEQSLKDCSIYRFNGLRNAQNAADKLKNLIDMEFEIDHTFDLEYSTFLLNDTEYNLIPEEYQADLGHALNKLRNLKTGFKFIYVTHSPNIDSKDFRYWTTIGRVYHIKSGEIEPYSLLSKNPEFSGRNLSSICEKLLMYSYDGVVDIRKYTSFNDTSEFLFDMFTKKAYHKRQLLRIGLDRLADFETAVINAQLWLEQENLRISKGKERIETLVDSIESSLVESQKQKQQIELIRVQQVKKTTDIEERKKKIDDELLIVKTSVDESSNDVQQNLKPEALNEIRSLRSPPSTIKDILDVLLILFGVSDLSWPNMKSYLVKHSLKDELKNFDFGSRLSEKLISKIESEISARKQSFDLKQAARASSAIVPIVKWIEATVCYGKALMKLKPFTNQLDHLDKELYQLTTASRTLILEQNKLNNQITDLTDKLRISKTDLEAERKAAVELENQICQARQAKKQSMAQVEIWQHQLSTLNSILGSNRIAELSFILAYLAINCDTSNISNEIDELGVELDIDIYKSIKDSLSLMIDFDSEESNLQINIRDKIIALLILKIIISGPTKLVPFINFEKLPSDNRLIEIISFMSLVVCPEDVTIIRCHYHASDWKDLLRAAMNLNKFAIILSNDPSVHLDILSIINSKDNSDKIVIVGDIKQHSSISRFLRTIDILNQTSSIDEIVSDIQHRILLTYDPDLSLVYTSIESELTNKNAELKALEKNLLSCLSRAQVVTKTDSTGSIDKELITMLSTVQTSRCRLNEDINQLKLRQDEVILKLERYIEVSREATTFYNQFISDLEGINDGFSHISVNKYMDIILNLKTTDNRKLDCIELDYDSVVRYAINSMRKRDRRTFLSKLISHGKQDIVARFKQNTDARPLTRVVCDLLGQPMGPRGTVNLKVMILLHEPTKSSPLVEIDDLFSNDDEIIQASHHNQSHFCHYQKVYASSDDDSNLESALLNIVRPGCYNSNDSKVHCESGSNSVPTKCLCVSNAHLSTRLINKLIPSLAKRGISQHNNKEHREDIPNVLIILIAECSNMSLPSGSAIKSPDINTEVMKLANSRYWYDESAVPPVVTFNLSLRLFLQSNKTSNSKHTTLAKHLILFHLMCQQLSACLSCQDLNETHSRCPPSWTKAYTFEANQLFAAFKILNKLVEDTNVKFRWTIDGEKYLRNRLSECLRFLLYGPRLDSREDRSLLARVLNQFIENHQWANSCLARLDQYLAEREQRQESSDELERQHELFTGLMIHVDN